MEAPTPSPQPAEQPQPHPQPQRGHRVWRTLLIVGAALVIFGSSTGVGLVVDELFLQPGNAASASSVPSAF
ncbi:MAG TPA: hypothetical protein VFU72_06590, partial [Nitrolancea sp.]|nr:hypothetical protein [Nitrolancea sp.]